MISDSKIHNIQEAEAAIKVTSSDFILKNTDIYDVLASGADALIKSSFESNIVIDHFKYYSAQVTLFNLESSNVEINNFEMYNATCTSSTSMAIIENSLGLILQNWTITNSSASNAVYFSRIAKSESISINNMTFEGIAQPPMFLKSNKATSINALNITG